MQSEYDIVIIGSGAGGSPIAHDLAGRGKSVLMLEKGPLILPQYQAGLVRDQHFLEDRGYADRACIMRRTGRVAKDIHLARVDRQNTGNHFGKCALAASVATEDRMDFAE